MRIEQIQVQRYGPLQPLTLELQGFNLLWAPNENGKTLFLEALLRLLLGNIRRTFPGIERVNKQPEGYAVVQMKPGQQIKLPEDGTLGDFFDLGVLEFRNLLVIRNSDLHIPGEAVFFQTITERLTGMQARKIQRIKERLKQLGGFTSTMDIVNHRESHYLKRRLQQAEELLIELSQLQAQAQEARLSQRLKRLREYRRQHLALNQELERLEIAGMVQKYQTASKELTRFRDLSEQLIQYKHLDVDLVVKWDIDEQTAQEITKRHQELLAGQEQIEQQLQQAGVRITGLHADLDRLSEWLTLFQQHVEPYWRRFGRRPLSSAKKRWFWIAQLFLGGTSATLIGFFWLSGNPLWLLGAGINLTALTSLAIWEYFYHIRPEKQLRRQIAHFRQECRQRNLAEVPPEQLPEAAEQARRDFHETEKELVRAMEQQAFWESRRNETVKELEQAKQQLASYHESLEFLKKQAQVDSLETLHKQVRQKQQLERQFQAARGALTALLGNPGDAEPWQFWQHQLQELARDVPPEATPDFDEQIYRKTLQAEQKLAVKMEALEKEVQRFEQHIPDLVVRANQILGPEGRLVHCRSWNDIEALLNTIQAFVDRHKAEQELTREALAILDKIETAEAEQLQTLFDGRLNAGDLLSRISDQRYQKVRFSPREQQLWIERGDGVEIPAEWLSSGGYDQLYFAIRISLARKVFSDQNAFLILDDPFLKSDRQRLQKQLDMLVELSQEGWQILYFSAKDEVKELLQGPIDKGLVHLQPAPGVR